MSGPVERLIEQVEQTGQLIEVTRDGVPVAVVIRYADWRELLDAADRMHAHITGARGASTRCRCADLGTLMCPVHNTEGSSDA